MNTIKYLNISKLGEQFVLFNNLSKEIVVVKVADCMEDLKRDSNSIMIPSVDFFSDVLASGNERLINGMILAISRVFYLYVGTCYIPRFRPGTPRHEITMNRAKQLKKMFGYQSMKFFDTKHENLIWAN